VNNNQVNIKTGFVVNFMILAGIAISSQLEHSSPLCLRLEFFTVGSVVVL
jgi:hypothetical protein